MLRATLVPRATLVSRTPLSATAEHLVRVKVRARVRVRVNVLVFGVPAELLLEYCTTILLPRLVRGPPTTAVLVVPKG